MGCCRPHAQQAPGPLPRPPVGEEGSTPPSLANKDPEAVVTVFCCVLGYTATSPPSKYGQVSPCIWMDVWVPLVGLPVHQHRAWSVRRGGRGL